LQAAVHVRDNEWIVSELLRVGASANWTTAQNRTPLILAIYHNAGFSVVKMLVEAKADLRVKDGSGNLLHLIARREDLDWRMNTARYLLNFGLQDCLRIEDINGFLPIKLAQKSNNLDLARFYEEQEQIWLQKIEKEVSDVTVVKDLVPIICAYVCDIEYYRGGPVPIQMTHKSLNYLK